MYTPLSLRRLMAAWPDLTDVDTHLDVYRVVPQLDVYDRLVFDDRALRGASHYSIGVRERRRRKLPPSTDPSSVGRRAVDRVAKRLSQLLNTGEIR